MDLTGIGSIADLIKDGLDRIIPDPAQRAAATLQLEQLKQAGEFKTLDSQLAAMQGQVDIDKIEAGSASLFVSGWRPFIGWVCGVSLFTYYVPYCIVATVIWAHQCWIAQTLVGRPDLGIADLIGLLSAMLGIAGMRTAEKFYGVAGK